MESGPRSEPALIVLPRDPDSVVTVVKAVLAMMNAWDDPDEVSKHTAWVDALWRQIAPRTDGAYANFLDDEGKDRVRAAFTPEAFARLVGVKRRYDPDNLFRRNANISPAQTRNATSRRSRSMLSACGRRP